MIISIEYTGIDVSLDNINYAKKNFKDANFENTTIQNFSTTQKFDLVLSSYVLQHIKPNDIEYVMKKMTSLTAKHIVCIENFKKSIIAMFVFHNFIHNYKTLLENNNLKFTQINIPVKKLPTAIFYGTQQNDVSV